MTQVSDIVQNRETFDLDEDLGKDAFVGGKGPAGYRVGEGVEFRENETGLESHPHGDCGQCLFEMIVVDLDALLVIDAHVPDLEGVDGVLAFSLELAQEFREFELDVFDCFFLFDPLWQLALHFLGVQETTLVHFVLLLGKVDGPAAVLRTQLLRVLLEVVLHLAHHARALSAVQCPFGLLAGPRVVLNVGGVI